MHCHACGQQMAYLEEYGCWRWVCRCGAQIQAVPTQQRAP